jgi:hypothetical protein
MYLEPIFSAQDIQKQLPSEYRAFDHVHKQLREIMRRTKDRPNALQTASNPSEGLVDTLRCLVLKGLPRSSTYIWFLSPAPHSGMLSMWSVLLLLLLLLLCSAAGVSQQELRDAGSHSEEPGGVPGDKTRGIPQVTAAHARICLVAVTLSYTAVEYV